MFSFVSTPAMPKCEGDKPKTGKQLFREKLLSDEVVLSSSFDPSIQSISVFCVI